ncbi:hypothetical protein POY61_17330 [Phocaeicola vulgatus]|nr:hypothetical protein [Phocaeicola vulgatus]
MDLNNIVGFKAVDKNGNERQVTVDEMTELVSARIVSAASEISTFAAAAAAGTDEFEDQLPQSDTFSWLRTLDGSKNPTLTSSTAAAKVLGELQLNENYFLVNHMLGEGALYKLNYPKDINVTFDIIGEGNSENADIFSFVSHHVKGLSVVKSIGPNLLKIYKDGDHNYYVYMPVFSRALIYFTNRVSMDNAISATKVDIDISTLTQVGI